MCTYIVHTYIHTYICANIRTHIHTCAHTCMHACRQTYMHIHTYIHAEVHMQPYAPKHLQSCKEHAFVYVCSMHVFHAYALCIYVYVLGEVYTTHPRMLQNLRTVVASSESWDHHPGSHACEARAWGLGIGAQELRGKINGVLWPITTLYSYMEYEL